MGRTKITERVPDRRTYCAGQESTPGQYKVVYARLAPSPRRAQPRTRRHAHAPVTRSRNAIYRKSILPRVPRNAIKQGRYSARAVADMRRRGEGYLSVRPPSRSEGYTWEALGSDLVAPCLSHSQSSNHRSTHGLNRAGRVTETESITDRR